jgi:UDP-2,3-diacylglucosamine hydrolase
MIQRLPRTAFCSDLHLEGPIKKHEHVEHFFNTVQHKAQALVILGDLFDSWWGDDHQSNDYHAWEGLLKSISIPCYFLTGNRDFLIGKQFYHRTGTIPLQSGQVIMIGDKKIALFHGDEPGLIDPWYQLWRQIVRQSVVKRLFLATPESLRSFIATQLRRKRQALTKSQLLIPTLTIDINQWLLLCEQQPDIIINGHLHYSLVQELSPKLTRYQLGCWDNQRYSFVIIDPSGRVERYDG